MCVRACTCVNECMCVCVFVYICVCVCVCMWVHVQVDHIYIQSLRGIKDLHENGINETNFHEVCMTCPHLLSLEYRASLNRMSPQIRNLGRGSFENATSYGRLKLEVFPGLSTVLWEVHP